MRLLWIALTILACLTAARGFFRTEALAGHDTAAYYVSQSEFHENLRAGNLWPRWCPDNRFGYGDVKLQHRPPVSHFLAEPFVFLTGRRITGVHGAVILLIFFAGGGMFLLTRRPLGLPCAAVATTGYVTANYFLANLYLRGAWYEAAAYAAMPWILWANEELTRSDRDRDDDKAAYGRRIRFFVLGALVWVALICGHPQTGMVFAPLAVSHVWLRLRVREVRRPLAWTAGAFAVGLMLSAPYWLAFRLEMPYVRMHLYDLGLQSYFRNFLDLKRLVFDAWPAQYQMYTGNTDYLNRPIHVEMLGLNLWAIVALAAGPFFWFGRWRERRTAGASLFFYGWTLGLITFALPLSWGLWERLRVLQYFNFPWRALGVASLCLTVLMAVTLRQFFVHSRLSRAGRAVAVSMVLTALIVGAWPHTVGWSGQVTEQSLQPENIRLTDGIPQHFHTPRWVKNYPIRPAEQDAEILNGQGIIENLQRGVTEWTLDVRAETAMALQFNHHYYPGWELVSEGGPTVEAQPAPGGWMVFQLPTGEHKLTLRFGSTAARKTADGLGLAGGVLLMGALFSNLFRFGRRKSKKNADDGGEVAHE